jgi:hypothetical protein
MIEFSETAESHQGGLCAFVSSWLNLLNPAKITYLFISIRQRMCFQQ